MGDQEDEVEPFDPQLGMAIADSWWILGRRLNRLRVAKTPETRASALAKWAQDVFDAEDESSAVRRLNVVTPEALDQFATTALRLLEKKYRGENIADEVSDLIHPTVYKVRDSGQFLVLDETAATFWAIEYYMLFSELDSEAYEPPGWLTAVGICENERCRRFFVRQRSDNRFDTESCRTNRANRDASKRRRRHA